MMRLLTPLLALMLMTAAASAQSPEQLKKMLKDDAVRGDWNYDNLEAGFAKAKATGKPMLVIFRCVL